MSGCFGNDAEDKYFENQLLNHTDPKCPECGGEYDMCICEGEDDE